MQKWREENLQEVDGIIVGTDSNLEWALPWWWHNYNTHNAYPVIFVDFGMSEQAKQWCCKRGEVCALNVSEDFVTPIDKISPKFVRLWNQTYGESWRTSRPGWFKKPLALLQTPYLRTIWMDIDCEVRGKLDPLFPFCHNLARLSVTPVNEMAQEKLLTSLRLPNEVIYSSGVIVYKRHALIIQEWANRALTQNATFYGDQDLLSRILYEHQTPFSYLPELYHYLATCEAPSDVVIKHWGGREGKRHIFISMQKLSSSFPEVLDLMRAT